VKPSCKQGFTMIEFLIAILLTTIVLGGLLATFQGGLSAWERIDHDSERLHESRIFIQLFEKELRNMISYSEAPFAGEESKLTFTTLVDQIADGRLSKVPAQVTYAFAGKEIFRVETPLRDEFNALGESKRRLIPDVKAFRLQYAYTSGDDAATTWKPDWKKGQGLPRGIRVEFHLAKNQSKQRKETEFHVIAKNFFIPQGNWGWIAKAQS